MNVKAGIRGFAGEEAELVDEVLLQGVCEGILGAEEDDAAL